MTSILETEGKLVVEQLYREHCSWLQAWLRGQMGNTSDVADLAQDTFLRVLKSYYSGRVLALQRPRAYLSTVARGLVVDHWRRQALEQAFLEEMAARPQATALSPEARLLVLQTLEEVARILDGLSARVREVFLLSQFDGLGYVDIASRLGLTVNQVQKAMIKAMTHCYRVKYDAFEAVR